MQNRATRAKRSTNGPHSAHGKPHTSKNTRKSPSISQPDQKSTTTKTKPRKFSQEFREATLVKIDVDIDELRKVAPITPILEEAEGGLPAVLAAMRFSTDPTITKFLREYDAGSDIDRIVVPWEAWALKAKIELHTLLGEIIFALRQQSVNAVKVLAITSHPDVVKARIKNAKTPRGYKDRDALDTALGLLPQQKGATFIGKFFAAGAPDPETPNPDQGHPEEPDVDELFPDIESTQLLLTE